jgi:NTP pyrophosphatase (non-canonical NTP hydrolase)
MTKKIDFKKYQEFVDAVTSDASKDFLSLTERMVELDQKGANIERILTAGVGMNAEAGEFLEIIKKMLFQGKPWNQDNKEHLVIELGDVMWYITQACIALGVSLDEVISGNVDKLMKRYPRGNFDVFYSENRSEDDR